MNELKKILDDSDATNDVKQSALTLALQIATSIAYQNTKLAAGGEFFALLMQLFQLLLPILLELLKPKVATV